MSSVSLLSPAVGSSPSAPHAGVGAPPSSMHSRAFRSSGLSGLARRLREERAHQRAQRCTTALRACGLRLVMLADGEGDAHVTSTVVTVILVHRHAGSSSRLQGPLTVPPKSSGPKSTAGAIPRLAASHHGEIRLAEGHGL